MRKRRGGILSLLMIVSLRVFCSPASAEPNRLQHEFRAETGISPEMGRVIDAQRAALGGKMRKNKIPGVAVALVDRERILWAAGFGYTDTDNRTPVTPETIFSIQSMSKTFTATAVLFAVQDGLLDLDAPITMYLPEFTVQSRFEEHPERKITLRHLLSHTAGFTHEAPVGNNFETPSPSFEEHVRSISRTWLKFPVGTQSSYSNLGIDLAGYIVQRVAKKPLARYMREKVFDPLDMPHSSMDMDAIKANPDRAIGHSSGIKKLPLEVPMLAAGGVYTNAMELCRFVQFHLHRGRVGGPRLLEERLLDRMYGRPTGPTLGLGRGDKHDSYFLMHGGGGFGFLSLMIWYPEYGIGAVELTNSASHSIQGQICNQLLDEIIQKGLVPKRAEAHREASSAPAQPPAPPEPVFTPTPYKAEWGHYAGTYRAIWKGYEFTSFGNFGRALGFGGPSWKVHRKDGFLYLGDEALLEYQLGLFFTPSGEALDLRTNPPTFRNIELAK
ncbi:MAG: beta-lactamase family protein [Planctomycetes bacterium]|nr:beta-lactamase family protein [Planctomycetota bacterium]